MDVLKFVFILVGFLIMSTQCRNNNSEPKIGQPQFNIQAQGGGNLPRNLQLGYSVGVGTKVWESQDKQINLKVGVNYDQNIGRQNGQTIKSPPHFGVGATFTFGRK